jgi:hypothetical protein
VKPDNNQHRAKAAAFLVACAFVFAVGNLVVAPVLDRSDPSDLIAVVAFALLGALAAQGALHSTWCVFAPVAWYVRLAVAAVAAMLWFGTWAVGFCETYDRPYLGVEYVPVAVAVLLCLPLIAVAIQTPLWLARFWLHWRVRHQSDQPEADGTPPLRIRHIMLFTAVAALALGLVRLASSFYPNPALVTGVVGGALWAMFNSLFILLPVLAATLKSARLWLYVPACVLVGGGIYLGVLVSLAISFGEDPPAQAYAHVAAAVAGIYVNLAGVLLVMRRLGYRLEWGRPATRQD